MASEEQEQQRSFRVQDRRRFSETGEARTTEGAPNDAAAQSPSGSTAAPPREQGADPLPEITFANFLIGLSAQALALLGEIPDPVERATKVDLASARQIIDILGLLRDKTKGNLDAAEASLLDNVLYDLRMKYVERAHGR